jgi:hypothetical protein
VQFDCARELAFATIEIDIPSLFPNIDYAVAPAMRLPECFGRSFSSARPRLIPHHLIIAQHLLDR